MNILYLPIKKKWFDMIATGIKKEEYRAHNYRYAKIFDKKYDIIEYRNGYGLKVPRLQIELLEVEPGYGCREWGGNPGKLDFVLSLGKIIWIKNWKGAV